MHFIDKYMPYQQLELSTFVDACAVQGIAVDETIYSPVSDSYLSPTEPDAWASAIIRAGVALSGRPDIRLVSNTVPEELLGEYPTIAQLALLGIVNTSLKRVQLTELPTVSRNEKLPVNPFAYSEEGFGKTYDAMANAEIASDENVLHDVGWTIFTHRGTAVAISKDNENREDWSFEREMLTFEPFVIDGVRFPRGALYAGRISALGHVPAGRRSNIDTQLIDSLTPQRLSAYAINPSERAFDYKDLMAEFPDTSSLRIVSLERMQYIAQCSLLASAEVKDPRGYRIYE
jgi:hypothetical protein